MKFPVQFGHSFLKGQFINPVISGKPTQTNVQTRYDDGSASHVIFSLIVDGNTNDTITLGFIEGQSTAGNIGSLFPVDIVIEHWNFDFTVKTYSCSIQDLINSGNYQIWLSGPICTVLIAIDNTGGHDAYFQGSHWQTGVPYEGGKSFRPAFYIIYWHELQKADVIVAGENTNTEALQEHAYSLRIVKSGTIVYQKQWMVQWRNSIWSLRFSDVPTCHVKFKLNYLNKTGCIPNYDSSVTLNENVIATTYQQWLNVPKDIQDQGNWNPAMGSGGAAFGIGPYPIAHAYLLFNNDVRMRESSVGNSRLSGNWPIHFRENNPSKSQYGKPMSIIDRPSITTFNLGYTSTAPEDRVRITGDPDVHGWVPDIAHHPDPYFPLYLLTGHPFWFYELWFTASYCVGFSNGAATTSGCGRGPTGKEGGLVGMRCGQMRGEAWAFRIMCEFARIMPDSMPYKATAIKHVLDCITIWEGQRNINPRNDPLWLWGRNTSWSGQEPPPLHTWDYGNGAFVQSNINPATCSAAISTWEQHFIMYSLQRGKELDFPTQPLIDWLSYNYINQATNPDYNPFMLGNYRTPTIDINGNPYRTFKDAMTGVLPTFDLQDGFDRGISGGLGAQDGYCKMAMTAMNATGHQGAINVMKQLVYDRTDWANTGTRWDILAR